MKTAVNKKNKQFIRIEQTNITKKLDEKRPSVDENNVEIQMIQMAPSFIGMPLWKFFVVKDKNQLK